MSWDKRPRKKWKPDGDTRWTFPQKPAPGDLRIVQALVSTEAAGKRPDGLGSPAALAEWLELWGLWTTGPEPSDDDLKTMLELRAALRAMVVANRTEASTRDAFLVLDRMANEALIRVRFHAGAVTFEPAAYGMQRVLAKIFEIVALAQHTGLWVRLRFCLDEGCGNVLFDRYDKPFNKWCCLRCRRRQSSRTYRQRRKNLLQRYGL